MAGLGAAIGGFAQGAAQGLKLRSDLEDAASKREFMGLQGQKLQQEVDEGAQFAELQKNMALETNNYVKGEGAYAPAEGQKYDPTAPDVVDNYYNRLGAFAKQQAILAKKNPLEVDEFMNKARKEKFSERVMAASQMLTMGNPEGLDMIKPQFKQMFGVDMTNATYNKDTDSFDIAYKGKDGADGTRSVKRQAFAEGLLPLALNPADAAKFAMQNKELAQRETEFAGLTDYRNAQLKLEGRKLDQGDKHLDIEERKTDGLLTYYDRMGRAALSKASTDKSSVDLARQSQALNNQLGSVVTLLGIDKKFDPSMASKTDIEAHDAKLAMANSAMYLVSSGIQDGGKLKVTADQAIKMVQAAENVPFSDVKRAGPGLFYTEIDGMKVPVNMKESQYQALAKANAPKAAPGAAPAAAPASTRPGIATPSSRLNDSLPPEAEAAGSGLDAARAELGAATAKVRSYGLSQQRNDPQGYQAAMQAYEVAKSKVAASETQYQNAIPRGLRGPSLAQ